MLKKPTKQPPPPTGNRDIFDARDARQGPLVLRDCTSVEWPTKEDVARYRKTNGLEPGNVK